MAAVTTPGLRSELDPRLAPAIKNSLNSAADSGLELSDLEMHDPRFVARIADQIRRVLDEALYQAMGWRALQNPMAASQFVIDATKGSGATPLLLSTSGRGYVREAAVHRASNIMGPFALALLVHRLNDWVPNVRQAAEARLSEMAPSLDRGTIAACAEYLWRFEEFGRASAIGRDIVAKLISDDATTAYIRDWLLQNSNDRAVRIIQQLLRSNAIDDLLVELARQHKHPRVRAIASRVALEGVFAWRGRTNQKRSVTTPIDRMSLAQLLLDDRSIDVQHHALQYLSQNLADGAALDGLLKRYLLHPRAKLSDLAQWRLTKRGVDWLSWVRQQFRERPLDLTIARLLSRVGTQDDGECLWASSEAAPANARLTFLLGATRLKHQKAIEAARCLALHSEEVGVARSAAAALLEAGEIISTEELAAATGDAELFVRRGLLAHVRRLPMAEQLAVLCQLEASGRPPDSQELVRLSRRINRGKFDLTARERTELQRLAPGSPRVASWMRRFQIL